jgi:hypothetical protein
MSVPVSVIKNPSDFTTPASITTDPNPVFAELQPAVPPKRVRKPHRPKKPKPAAAALPRRLLPHRARVRRSPIRTRASADLR